MSRKLMRGFTLKFLYPLLMFAGSLAKNRKESYQRFIIDLNNRLIRRENLRRKKILLLLPHCLQINECDVRLTYNIYNCKRCGKCGITDLIRIAEENNITLFIGQAAPLHGGSCMRLGRINPDPAGGDI